MIELSVEELIRTIYNNSQFFQEIQSESFARFLDLRVLVSNDSCGCTSGEVPEDVKNVFLGISSKEPEIYSEIMSISQALYDNREIKLIE